VEVLSLSFFIPFGTECVLGSRVQGLRFFRKGTGEAGKAAKSSLQFSFSAGMERGSNKRKWSELDDSEAWIGGVGEGVGEMTHSRL